VSNVLRICLSCVSNVLGICFRCHVLQQCVKALRVSVLRRCSVLRR
jgi:hypothetical protein